MIAGRRALDRVRRVSAATGPLPSRGGQRIDDAAEQRRPDRHAHDIAASRGPCRPPRCASTSSSRTQPTRSRVEHLGEAELSLVEAQKLIEPARGQAGNERDAVADLLDAADLFEPAARARRCRAWPGFARARHPPGVRRGLVMRELAEDAGEIGAAAVAHDEHAGRAARGRR